MYRKKKMFWIEQDCRKIIVRKLGLNKTKKSICIYYIDLFIIVSRSVYV